MRKLFGTDGVRGVANVYPMTADISLQLGRAIASVFKKEPRRHKIVIGKDTRLSGYMIENAMVAGICSMGVDVMLVGPLPTPGIAFITSSMRADAGAVISASHNPYQDNGIKFFSRDGFKLPDALEAEMERLILENHTPSNAPTAGDIGKAYRIDDAIGRYVVYAKNTFPKELTLDGLKIAVDCANGAAYRVAPEVFYELGAEVFAAGVNPNGENINAGCGSLYPDVVADLVKEKKADIGIALDGDGDRVILVDERGRFLDGDHIMAIMATHMMKKNILKKKTLVSTIMSNMGLEEAIKRSGGKVVRTQVGDRYVVEEMLKHGYNLGGEQSGHIIFMDHTTTGDGIISALQILSVMVQENKKLSGLADIMEKFPQILLNVKVHEKREISKMPLTAKRIKEVEGKLDGNGRLSVRYSGTEMLARVMIEGRDAKEVKRLAKYIADAIEEEIG